MSKPLVVGVDGSERSLRALDWAAAEASARGVPLRIVYGSLWDHYTHVTPGSGTDGPDGLVPAEQVVGAAARHVADVARDVPVSTDVPAEDPAAALIREGRDAFAVVVGDRGRGELAGLLLGSTGLVVAGRAECPVVVVRGPENRPSVARVVLGVENAGGSAAATGFALGEAAAHDAELVALHAWRRPGADPPGALYAAGGGAAPEVRAATRELEEALAAPAQDYPNVTVRTQVPEGRPRTALLSAARPGDLLVAGARRRHGTVGLQLGPVNHALLHHAPCPVAIVPQES
ncbi:universal stress protein [Actinacidiphila acididurans]|uniref:Universal stress protein n=1 Tax=Actinacidiphila acididurans TaxID=2784346 RepID=A0ABS2TLR6_9ACTN|nr:universal stress protein [Actinacidiphila acididurans]MBM9504285.1 universal stress protein [Actinacidiphila acididurans]